MIVFRHACLLEVIVILSQETLKTAHAQEQLLLLALMERQP